MDDSTNPHAENYSMNKDEKPWMFFGSKAKAIMDDHGRKRINDIFNYFVLVMLLNNTKTEN